MKLTKITKKELNSIFHTFLAVFIPLLVISLQDLNLDTISRETAIAFGVAVLRSAIKALSQLVIK